LTGVISLATKRTTPEQTESTFAFAGLSRFTTIVSEARGDTGALGGIVLAGGHAGFAGVTFRRRKRVRKTPHGVALLDADGVDAFFVLFAF
jgi:hypothetical protein